MIRKPDAGSTGVTLWSDPHSKHILPSGKGKPSVEHVLRAGTLCLLFEAKRIPSCRSQFIKFESTTLVVYISSSPSSTGLV